MTTSVDPTGVRMIEATILHDMGASPSWTSGSRGSACLLRKTGEEKLQLHHRTFRCGGCGLEMDRDDNAARNLRRIGIQALLAPRSDNIRIDHVGQVMPERGEGSSLPPDACGDPSAGPAAPAAGPARVVEAGSCVRGSGENP